MGYSIGIDLGTTNSVACVWRRGTVETIPIDGRATMPSALSVRPDGALLVGQAAKKEPNSNQNSRLFRQSALLVMVKPNGRLAIKSIRRWMLRLSC